MRQPSADDLDAAQQLVESARGERQGTHASSSQPDQAYATTNSTTIPSTGQTTEAGQYHVAVMEESNGLGQACR